MFHCFRGCFFKIKFRQNTVTFDFFQTSFWQFLLWANHAKIYFEAAKIYLVKDSALFLLTLFGTSNFLLQLFQDKVFLKTKLNAFNSLQHPY